MSSSFPIIISLARFREQAYQFAFGESGEHRHPGSMPDIKVGDQRNTISFSSFASFFSGQQIVKVIDQYAGNAPDSEVFLSIWPQRVRVCIAHP